MIFAGERARVAITKILSSDKRTDRLRMRPDAVNGGHGDDGEITEKIE